jgi:N-acetylglucosamine kinase-like BadF-type ATPase
MAGSRNFWQDFAAGLEKMGRVIAEDDSLPVLELATGGNPGLVVHAGTGSFVAARVEGLAPYYAGGLGWRFGDSGSGYDIGRRAIARTLLELQGWEPSSGVGDFVRNEIGLDDPGAISSHFYGNPSPNWQIASLAPGILRLLGEGDLAARHLVACSLGELFDLARQVSVALFPHDAPESLTAGLSGPIVTHPEVLPLVADLSKIAFRPIEDPPIEGVRRLLLRCHP